MTSLRLSLLALATLPLAACGGEAGVEPDGGPGPEALDPDWLAAPFVGPLAADESHVYYVSGLQVARVPVGGGTPIVLYEAPPTPDGALFADLPVLTVGPTDVAVVHGVVHDASSTTRSLVVLPKAGGPASVLATSGDPRSFLGVAFDDQHVYYSYVGNILRVPRAGGDPELVADGSTGGWAFSPAVTDDTVYWAEGTEIFKVAKTGGSLEGTVVAQLPGHGRIVDPRPPFVIAYSDPGRDFLDGFVTVDPTTGQVGPDVRFGSPATDVAVAGDTVWATAWDGLVRAPRDGSGATEVVLTDWSMYLAAVPGAVFLATEQGIARYAY